MRHWMEVLEMSKARVQIRLAKPKTIQRLRLGRVRQVNLALRRLAMSAQASGMQSLLASRREPDGPLPETGFTLHAGLMAHVAHGADWAGPDALTST